MRGLIGNNLNRTVPWICGTVVWYIAAVSLLAVPVGAAEFAGGTGAPATPFQIATAEQIASIGDDPDLLDKYFILVDDIDLDPNLPGGQVFSRAVIAHELDAFRSSRVFYSGRFYGNGHTIRHLTIDAEGLQYVGLFGVIGSNGRVYDVNLADVCISSADRAGGLAGFNRGGLVNCRVTGRICGRQRSSWLGGLVGVNTGAVIDCHSAATVTGGSYSLMLGSLVGMHRGGVIGGSATGAVHGGYGSLYLGGLVGACVGGTLRDSHAIGDISGLDACWGLGGLAGRADGGSTIANCYAGGNVTAGSDAHDLGGLVGSCYGLDITNSYAIGSVAGANDSYALGGLLGSTLAVSARDCYATGEVQGFRVLGGFVGQVRTGTTLTHCHAVGRVLRYDRPWGRGGFAGSVEDPRESHVNGCFWDVDTSGAAGSALGTGLTSAQMQDASTFQAAGWDLAGDATNGTADLWLVSEGGPHPILAAFSDSHEPHALEGSGASFDPYVIKTAEDLGAMRRYNGSAWYRLVADIDLSGVIWTTPPVPVFGGVFNGGGHRISNLTVKATDAEYLGLFGCVESGAWVYNLGLDNVSIVLADGVRKAGAVAGENAGYVLNCYATGTISAGRDSRSVGGLVGVNWLGVVADCYTLMTIEAVEAGAQVGGLVGYDYMGTLASGYAAGRVSGPQAASLGGLVGHSSENAGTFGCFYLASSTGGGPDSGAGIAATAEQLMQRDTFVDWDFDDTWMVCEGADYPHLLWEGLSCEQ